MFPQNVILAWLKIKFPNFFKTLNNFFPGPFPDLWQPQFGFDFLHSIIENRLYACNKVFQED